MSTVVYLTDKEGKIEVRTFVKGNKNHRDRFLGLLHEIATENPYKRITIEQI